jgi:hypothetical protein
MARAATIKMSERIDVSVSMARELEHALLLIAFAHNLQAQQPSQFRHQTALLTAESSKIEDEGYKQEGEEASTS